MCGEWRNMTEENEYNLRYVLVRYIQLVCIGAFIFGMLWDGTLVLNLRLPEFLMLYGGVGSVVTELLARYFKKKNNKKQNIDTSIWIVISIALALVLMLVGGIVWLYESKGLWGYESNPTANLVNTTFNNYPSLTIGFTVVVLVIAVTLIMTVSRGFG